MCGLVNGYAQRVSSFVGHWSTVVLNVSPVLWTLLYGRLVFDIILISRFVGPGEQRGPQHRGSSGADDDEAVPDDRKHQHLRHGQDHQGLPAADQAGQRWASLFTRLCCRQCSGINNIDIFGMVRATRPFLLLIREAKGEQTFVLSSL